MRRNYLLPVKLTADEKALLREIAEAAGTTVSEYIRGRAFSEHGSLRIYRGRGGREYREYKPGMIEENSAPKEERRTEMKRPKKEEKAIKHIDGAILARFCEIMRERQLETFNELFALLLSHYDDVTSSENEAKDPESNLIAIFNSFESNGIESSDVKRHFSSYVEGQKHIRPELVARIAKNYPQAAAHYEVVNSE